ncbi:MAG: VWA domain-containing protein [Gemmatimonadota bacterium]
MGLLAPLALLLAAAVAVPIILHLFQRHQGPRLVFPALRYLRRAEREHARRIKFRQLLLLALRVLALILLAVAAARPFFQRGGAAHAPSAVVIILDNSASSGAVEGDRRVLDVLKQRAIETLTRAGPDDQFWLLRAGSPWEPALRGDALTLADRVRETEPTASAANLRAAVERAAALLTAAGGNRALEIQLLSDLQATNLRGGANPPAQDLALVIWSPRREPPPNRGVADVEIGGGLAPRAGERTTVAVRIAGSAGSDSANIRLSVGGRTAAAGLAPAGAAALVQLPPQAEGMLTGWAEIDADAMRADDRRYFAIRVSPVPAVALGRPQQFLDQALSVLADAGRTRPTPIGAADIIIAPGGAGIESARPNAVVVVFPPESPIEIPGVNRRLAAAGIGWRYVPSTDAGEARFADDAVTGDPLLRQLGAVQLRQVYTLQPPPGQHTDSVALLLRDGRAWAVRGTRTSGGRFVLLATPFTLEASTLPASPAFLPLLDRILGAWSASTATTPDVAPGEPVALPGAARVVVHPDGVRDTIPEGESYRAPALPGVYRVQGENGGDVAAFVINPAEVESSLEPLATRRVREVFSDWTIELADGEAEWTRDIYQHRLGREIWWPLILALLLLLVAESFVAAAGRTAGRVGTTRDAPEVETPAHSLR